MCVSLDGMEEKGPAVSNWFINARVRLWKPMVEDMYQQELKEAEGSSGGEERENNKKQSSSSNNNNSGHLAAAQTPTLSTTASTTTTPPPSTTAAADKRSDHINATESDPSFAAINRQGFSENQAKHQQQSSSTATTTKASASEVAPPVSDSDLPPPHNNRSMATDDTCRHGSFVTAEYGTTSSAAASDIGSTLIRFGTTAGDVSLTLGLRHAGNMPEKNPFSYRDFGGI